MGLFDKLFGKKQEPVKPVQDKAAEKFYLEKDDALQHVLGKSAGFVGHAIIPFAVGGAVDMYYYPNLIEGTAFATQELIEYNGKSPIPNKFGTYELVAFTRHPYSTGKMGEGDFGKIERRFCGIFTGVGNFSYMAKLGPGETCELPVNNQPNRCLIFDEFKVEGKEFTFGGKTHSLLLIIEVHRDEMQFAMDYGSGELFKLLKAANVYPYSDLDRDSVVA